MCGAGEGFVAAGRCSAAPQSSGHISRSPKHLEMPLLSSVPSTGEGFRSRTVDVAAHSSGRLFALAVRPGRFNKGLEFKGQGLEGIGRVFSVLKQINNC